MPSSVIAVPGRPGFAALLWWFQGPDDQPGNYQFELNGQPIPGQPWRLDGLLAGFPGGLSAEGLKLARRTFLLVTRHTPGTDATQNLRVLWRGEASNLASARLLPRTADGLELLLASCYYSANSRLLPKAVTPRGRLAGRPPHAKLLCGDQIYLDLSLGGFLPTRKPTPWERYHDQWHDDAFLAWMANGGSLCLADDHEFWNNYPSTTRVTPWLAWLFQAPPATVAAQMREAFTLYQAVLNADPDALAGQANPVLVIDDLHRFEFPGAAAGFAQTLSLLVLDTRIARDAPELRAPNFAPPSWLNWVTARLAARNGPTLLLTTQPLLDRGGGAEANLADYPAQFSELWDAVWNSRHQVMLLTGDIHWSRTQVVFNRQTGLEHYEVVSSALARIHFANPLHNFSKLRSEVSWKAGKVVAQRLGDSDSPCTYATLELRQGSAGLQCLVRWWEINGDGQHVPMLMNAGIGEDLKRWLGMARAVTEHTFILR
ncbi:hypothetical protein [Pseudomonas sp. UFMG81]|uniref:hypothetical protein n=1 Tax=Pseudomonas sp. UFMG81 TaxID=2745936 RepID=UPI00188EE62C|nr:hypothetical protein [Pseudomonas sp. UFMG81]